MIHFRIYFIRKEETNRNQQYIFYIEKEIKIEFWFLLPTKVHVYVQKETQTKTKKFHVVCFFHFWRHKKKLKEFPLVSQRTLTILTLYSPRRNRQNTLLRSLFEIHEKEIRHIHKSFYTRKNKQTQVKELSNFVSTNKKQVEFQNVLSADTKPTV